MITPSEVNFPDTLVMYVAGDPAKPIPEQAKQAFAALEAGFTSLKGRKFFGVIIGNEYRACSSITDTDKTSGLPHPTWTIPGGKYARLRIPDWEKNTDQIGVAFEKLYYLSGVDPTRPAVEFYRSQREMFAMVPVK
jgi:hypothetical protein